MIIILFDDDEEAKEEVVLLYYTTINYVYLSYGAYSNFYKMSANLL